MRGTCHPRCIFLFVFMAILSSNGWCQTTYDSHLARIIHSILEPKTENDYETDINHDNKVTIADLCAFISSLQEKVPKERNKISLTFLPDSVAIDNATNLPIDIFREKANIRLTTGHLPDVLIEVSGQCDDGQLTVDADTTFTLRFSGLSLKSSHAPAILSTSKHAVEVEITDGTSNFLEDAPTYTIDSEEGSYNGCFHSEGTSTFSGRGFLTVSGHHKHAIYSKKSIVFHECNIIVDKAKSDAIHAGKNVSVSHTQLTLNGMGQDGMDAGKHITIQDSKLSATVSSDAAKGIKCTEDLKVERTDIQMSASGGIRNKDGDISYCTLMKSGGNTTFLDSDMKLVHSGNGGKCISCDGNMIISGGKYFLETSGDGGEYFSVTAENDYFTPKCIAVDSILKIESGTISCTSSGLGGKGIVAGECLDIGKKDTEGPVIDITTSGMCILDNEEEDERNGCPKAIKCSDIIYINSGRITCTTFHTGGEGIESMKSIKINGGTITCNTFDDGINAANGITVNAGYIYCNSINNDGLDSNGIITINGGTIKAISQHRFNECLDAEEHQIIINGGTIFGISGSPISIGSTSQPYFSQGLTEIWKETDSSPLREGALYRVHAPKGKAQMEITSPFTTGKAYFFISAPYLSTTQEYTIREQYIEGNSEIIRFTPTLEIINPY